MENRNKGWIEVICGSMFSGKTEELLRRLKRAKIAQQSILLVKPSVDNRYAETEVVSHAKRAMEAMVCRSSNEILDGYNHEEIVAIDEAQFFDKDLPNICHTLANRGVRVIVAGLDMDFKGQPFGTVPQLLAMAEYVTKVHAICVSCGNLAQFSHRTSIGEEGQVLVGAQEHYRPLCRTCFNQENT